MAPTPAEAIPLTVVAGYFGAGKTTWINYLISEGLTPDTVILVNDFGAINIDASLIEYQDEGVIQLQNGCICCTLGGTLAEAVADVLRRDPPPAALLIEASGIARPGPVANVARVGRSLRLAEVVCVVDCESIEQRLADPGARELVEAQLTESDTLLLNKHHDLPAEHLGALRQRLLAIHPQARVLEAPAALVPEGPAGRQVQTAGSATGGPDGTTSFTVRCARLRSRAECEAALLDHADVLVRAKGPVRFRESPESVHVLQFVNGRVTFTPARRAGSATQLVCIGARGERLEALRQRLAALAE